MEYSKQSKWNLTENDYNRSNTQSLYMQIAVFIS